MKTLRLKLLIAYDGRPFRGWQSQADGGAVQDFLENAFAKICGDDEQKSQRENRIAVHGAGRTDAGVHALAQCAHADVPARESHESRRKPGAKKLDWVAALNANLPREIRVLSCSRAANFHARFSARGKIYTYRIWNAPVFSPFEIGRAWHLSGALDVEAMRAAAAFLVGEHDFAAFAANRGKPEKSTVRTIHEIDVKQRATRNGALLTLRFRGNGFLYKMVRLMTGALVRVAQGRAEPSWIRELLETKTKSTFAAPAEGLYLTRVIY